MHETSAASNSSMLFFGQHNLEYFGEDEYMMFDNNLNLTSTQTTGATSGAKFVGDAPSRLLVMRLDEDARVAYMDWELKLEEQTCIYGDNDRLPTGNLLGCWWQSSTYAHDDAYDAKVVELVRASSEVAFELEVSSDRGCSAAASPCSVDGTWRRSTSINDRPGPVPSTWTTLWPLP